MHRPGAGESNTVSEQMRLSWLSNHMALIRDAAGRRSIESVHRDITDRNEMKRCCGERLRVTESQRLAKVQLKLDCSPWTDYRTKARSWPVPRQQRTRAAGHYPSEDRRRKKWR